MESRLCNTFETKNALKLTKAILERPYKVLESSQNGTIFEGPVHFSGSILSNFNV